VTYGEKRRVVTFNLDRPDERRLYELACTLNFSSFVKRHLTAEMQRRMELDQQSQLTVHLGEVQEG
jgi:hypothetical protein